MNHAPSRTRVAPRDRAEERRRWTAALLTALLHALLVMLVMLAPPITMTAPPEGGTAGSRMQVTWIDDALRPPPVPTPKPRIVPPRKPAKAAPPARRLRTTLVDRADANVATEAADSTDAPTTPPATETVQAPSEPAPPPASPDDTAPPQRVYGQPPGMLPQATADENLGPSAGPSPGRGRRSDASSGTSMEVGGYQVYYDLASETRLRAWRDQGMTELFLPLPGTRRLMVCPLEIALHRESGRCRLIEPDAPERKAIGDARDVINMQKVYKLGEELWSGPGAYR